MGQNTPIYILRMDNNRWEQVSAAQCVFPPHSGTPAHPANQLPVWRGSGGQATMILLTRS